MIYNTQKQKITFSILTNLQKDTFMTMLAGMFKFSGFLQVVEGEPYSTYAVITKDKLKVGGCYDMEFALDPKLWLHYATHPNFDYFENFLLISGYNYYNEKGCYALYLIDLDTRKLHHLNVLSLEENSGLDKYGREHYSAGPFDSYAFIVVNEVVHLSISYKGIKYLYSTELKRLIVQRLEVITESSIPESRIPEDIRYTQMCGVPKHANHCAYNWCAHTTWYVGKYKCLTYEVFEQLHIYVYSYDSKTTHQEHKLEASCLYDSKATCWQEDEFIMKYEITLPDVCYDIIRVIFYKGRICVCNVMYYTDNVKFAHLILH